MDISRLDPHDLDFDLADRLAEIEAAALEQVSLPHPTGDTLRLLLTDRMGEGPDEGLWVAYDDGVAVGWSSLALNHYENLDSARIDGAVHPDYQRRGFGRALLESAAAATDRPRTRVRTWVGTSGEGALPALGFAPAWSHVVRRLDLDLPVSDHLRREGEAASADYHLERFVGPVPEELIGDLQLLREAINDSPEEGEFEAYPPERIRAYERALSHLRQTPYTIVARHHDGRPAGLTMVCVPELRPTIAAQEDTSVLAAHRGHRLGLRLKVAMADWLREERPEVIATDTWNAPDNHHMIAINERLGCRVVANGRGFMRVREPRAQRP